MKHHRLYHHLISLLLALSMLAAVGCMSALAAPGDENQNNSQVETPQSQAEQTPQNPQNPQEQQEQQEQPQQNQPQQEQQQQEQQQQEQPQQEQPQQQQNQWYDPIYTYDEEATSPYVEPEHLAELPAVSPSQVQEATSVAIPVVAVSDASMFSGIVMWLCVALGIAVVVGVLVSRRTRRRG